MNRCVGALVVAAVALASAACLVKETTHRIYLSPSGSVAWMVLEQGVRSDEGDEVKQWDEERQWFDTIAGDAHAAVVGLRRLGPARLSTRLLRSERPYALMIDARFERVDLVIARLFEELGLRGDATLDVQPHRVTLSVSLDLSSVHEPATDVESPVTALLEDLDRYRFGLTDGRFVAATGFAIVENGAAATFQFPKEAASGDGTLALVLAWRPER